MKGVSSAKAVNANKLQEKRDGMIRYPCSVTTYQVAKDGSVKCDGYKVEIGYKRYALNREH